MPGEEIREPRREPIAVQTVDEEYDWLAAHPCACGAGWTLERQALVRREGTDVIDAVDVACKACGARRTEHFRVDTASEPYRSSAARAILADQLEAAEDGYVDDDWIRVGSLPGIEAWLADYGCKCGGRWDLGPTMVGSYAKGRLASTVAICGSCAELKPFVFALRATEPEY